MGDLIILSEHRRARAVGTRGSAVSFYFDLGSPYTYLAAERVDRMFGTVQWCPVLVDVPIGPISEPAVELRAAALRLPLVWPERFPVAATAASRVALYATKAGRAPAFVLACSRLAFCGGFDLSDPEILAEAAAAAGLPLDECARAARDDSLDDQLRAAGLRIRARGAEVLPALSVGRLLFGGEEHIPEAAAAARSGLVAPLAHTRS